MRWPWVKLRKFVSALFYAHIFASDALALDDKSLWLPTSHAKLFLELKEAALAAEALERCSTVLRGTVDLEQSKPDHPIYRIMCRQPNMRTYNEMVDGLTFETLTTKFIPTPEPTVEEKEARKRELWSLCEAGLMERTRLMTDVSWLEKDSWPQEPEVFEEESALFTVVFDAKDVYGQALQYQAVCRIEADDKLSIKISGRAK